MIAIRKFTTRLVRIVPLAIAVGCGPPMGKVTGTLETSDGKPLYRARVTVRNDATGEWATAVTDNQGRFELGTDKAGNGVPPGDYYVIVVEDQGDWDNPSPPMIATKYSKPATSGLKLQVIAGESLEFHAKLDPPDKKKNK